MLSAPEGIEFNREQDHHSFFHRHLLMFFFLISSGHGKLVRYATANYFENEMAPFLLVTTQVILGVFSVLTSVQIVPIIGEFWNG
jgi:heme A synthase